MICLFEDALVANFSPVADTRHLSHLLVGTRTLRARAVDLLGDSGVFLHGRRYIREYYQGAGERVDPSDEDTIFINSRYPLAREHVGGLLDPGSGDRLLMHRGEVVAGRLRGYSMNRLDWEDDYLDFGRLSDIPRYEIDHAESYEYLWDMIYDNGRRIVEESADRHHRIDGTLHEGSHLVNSSGITMGRGSHLRAGAIIDATTGPVIIEDDVDVMHNAVILGPCFIGAGSVVKVGAKIYPQTSIGPRCKIGGEVEDSIILGYTNKQHDGFLGHSYLGRWVNLGADTNTSDLKNNYGTVRATINGQEINSGRLFLGALVGDHAKTAINTMLNTGTVIGVGANVFGAGFPPKSIPAFAWGGYSHERFRIDDALELARRVMARRGIEFTSGDDTLLRYLDSQSM